MWGGRAQSRGSPGSHGGREEGRESRSSSVTKAIKTSGARGASAAPDPASGADPGGRRDVPNSNLGGGVRKRNSAGAAPATLFPPPDSLPPPFPRLSSLPDPGRAAIPLPLSGRPSSPSFRTNTSLYRTPRGPLRPSPPPWPHGPSRRPLMLPAARWPGPQCT